MNHKVIKKIASNPKVWDYIKDAVLEEIACCFRKSLEPNIIDLIGQVIVDNCTLYDNEGVWVVEDIECDHLATVRVTDDYIVEGFISAPIFETFDDVLTYFSTLSFAIVQKNSITVTQDTKIWDAVVVKDESSVSVKLVERK